MGASKGRGGKKRGAAIKPSAGRIPGNDRKLQETAKGVLPGMGKGSISISKAG